MSTSPITSRTLLPAAASPSHRVSGNAASPPAPTAHAPTAHAAAADTIVAGSARATQTLRDAAREHESSTASAVDGKRRSALVAALLVHVPAADRAAAKTAIPAILDAARKTGSSDPNRIAYLLATAQTESDFGANMTETGHSKTWFNATYGCQDGNRPGTGDGYDYRGRGYVQTTHAGRYAELSRRLGLPDVPALGRPGGVTVPALVAHPEKLAEPKLAAEALVVGVTKNLFTHNAAAALDRTIPTGRKPGDADFFHARGIVNGIVADQARTIANHATIYAQILDSYRHSVLGAPAPK